MLSGHILVHRVRLTSFGHKLLDLHVSVAPLPHFLCGTDLTFSYMSGVPGGSVGRAHLLHKFGTFAYIIHTDMSSHTFKHIPVYITADIVNVLNIVNVQTYFIYVCYIAIFLLADQLKLRRVKV